MDVRQQGSGCVNVTGHGCLRSPDRFLNCQNICHGSEGADRNLIYDLPKRCERNKMLQCLISRNKTLRRTVAEREACISPGI